MARISFKAKRFTVYHADNTPAYDAVKLPREFTRAHCDMDAFRRHPKFGGIANSQLFPNVLARIKRETFGTRDAIRLDQIPAGVTVDTTGFLATVSFEV